jgi:hypothetical protein
MHEEMRWILLALLLSGCDVVTRHKVYRYDKDIQLISEIVSSGGALGDETFTVAYRIDGKDIKFFEGTNPHGWFRLARSGDTIAIRFCDGRVTLASPIYRAPRHELIHLKLDLDCPDRAREKQVPQ